MTDAFDEIAVQLHLELFAAFVQALGPEDRYSTEEPDGVAAVKGPDGHLHELRRDTLRVVAAELERLRAAAEQDERPDPAAEYGGDLTPPLCCCKRGLMCGACGSGSHRQCPDRDDWDDEADDGEDWIGEDDDD